MGTTAEITTALTEIVDGPQLATKRDFAMLLGRLAIHFWQPDFTPEQVKLKLQDYEEDLAGVTVDELREACAEWRRDPLNNFYPKSGQLLEIVKPMISDRARQQMGAQYLLSIMDAPTSRAIDVSQRLHALGEKLRGKNVGEA